MDSQAKFKIYAALVKVAEEIDRADDAFVAHEPCGLHREHQELLDIKNSMQRMRQSILEMP